MYLFASVNDDNTTTIGAFLWHISQEHQAPEVGLSYHSQSRWYPQNHL